MILPLTPDELLSTTRSVRRRLDLTRPVEREVIEQCLALAQQAPTASNTQLWHFVVVTDPAQRAGLADLYRRGREANRARPRPTYADPARQATQARVTSSADYLAEHMHEVPVLVVPCIAQRTDNQPVHTQSAVWGTIGPAIWSLMLAARSRGLGAVWTSVHLRYERESAELLGIPYDSVMQTALVPVAYTIGTNFKPALREPLSTMVHWEQW